MLVTMISSQIYSFVAMALHFIQEILIRLRTTTSSASIKKKKGKEKAAGALLPIVKFSARMSVRKVD